MINNIKTIVYNRTIYSIYKKRPVELQDAFEGNQKLFKYYLIILNFLITSLLFD